MLPIVTDSARRRVLMAYHFLVLLGKITVSVIRVRSTVKTSVTKFVHYQLGEHVTCRRIHARSHQTNNWLHPHCCRAIFSSRTLLTSPISLNMSGRNISGKAREITNFLKITKDKLLVCNLYTSPDWKKF